MDRTFKLLKRFIDTTSRNESSKLERVSTIYDAPAVVGQQLKQSTCKFLPTMKCAVIEPSKYQQFNAGSRSSQLSAVNVVDLRIDQNYWSKSQ